MSQYLVIKKDGVKIGEWSRSTEMYDAFPCASYNENKFDAIRVFANAKSYFNQLISDTYKSIELKEKVLQGDITFDERWSIAGEIIEDEENIERLNKYNNYVDFMIEIYECDEYCDYDDGKTHNIWTYIIQ